MKLYAKAVRCDCGAVNSPLQRRCARCGDTLDGPPDEIKTPAPPRAGDWQRTAAYHFDRLRAIVDAAPTQSKP